MLEVPGTSPALPVSVLRDTGAEVNIIDDASLEGLTKLGSEVEFVQIQPFSVSVAFETDTGSARDTVSRLARLDIELYLSPSGRLRLRDITFHVVSKRLLTGTGLSKRPEVILGVTTLDSLRFRFQGHLQSLVNDGSRQPRMEAECPTIPQELAPGPLSSDMNPRISRLSVTSVLTY
jgi:hypothetical protein